MEERTPPGPDPRYGGRIAKLVWVADFDSLKVYQAWVYYCTPYGVEDPNKLESEKIANGTWYCPRVRFSGAFYHHFFEHKYQAVNKMISYIDHKIVELRFARGNLGVVE